MNKFIGQSEVVSPQGEILVRVLSYGAFCAAMRSLVYCKEFDMGVPPELLAGYSRFRQDSFAREARRYRALASMQSPRTMVIGCADSRVDPATIFSAAPGELFIVRNIAALVPPFEETGTYHGTSAAIEFAVRSLNVEIIVVLGHGMCGGISAALAAAEQRPVGRFVEPPDGRAAFSLGGCDVSAEWERTMLPGVGTVYVASAVAAEGRMTDTFTVTAGDVPARSE